MKSKLISLLFILLIFSCTNQRNTIRKDIIKNYFQAHKAIFNEGREIDFPEALKNILSEELIEEESLWFEQNFRYEDSQLFEDKSFSLGKGAILGISINNDKVLVKFKTYHLEYFYNKRSNLEDIQNKYNCDPDDIETILNIHNKLDEMSNNGLITGKGWVPMFETHENYTFEFNESNKIENIEIDIISGKLTETYDEVITEYTKLNN